MNDIWVDHLKDRMKRYNFILDLCKNLESYLEKDGLCAEDPKICAFTFKRKYMVNSDFTQHEWENYIPKDFLYVSGLDSSYSPERDNKGKRKENLEYAFVNYAYISKNTIARLENNDFNLDAIAWDVMKVMIYTKDATPENLEVLTNSIKSAWETSFELIKTLIKAKKKYIKECKLKSIIVDSLPEQGTNVGV